MKTYFYMLMVGSLLGVCAACGGQQENPQETAETVLPDEVATVTVQPLRRVDFQHELMSNGKLAARRRVDLRFESTAIIAHVYVKNGDRVRKGTKLAELDGFRLVNQVSQALDALNKAKLEMQDVLIGQGYMLADSAKVPEATLRLAKLKSGYDQALAAYELALYEQGVATLEAPFDGVIANLFTRQGNPPSSSEPFCTVIDPQSLEADFTVLENELPLIKMGDPVEVSPYAAADLTVAGRISEINPMVDDAGMVRVRATVSADKRLFEGMNVRVSVRRSLGHQLVVPKQAVVLRSGKQVVFTLVNGKAYWNYVRTGLENAGSYTILEGLKEGDEVIISGNINLAHEAPVTVVDRLTEEGI